MIRPTTGRNSSSRRATTPYVPSPPTMIALVTTAIAIASAIVHPN